MGRAFAAAARRAWARARRALAHANARSLWASAALCAWLCPRLGFAQPDDACPDAFAVRSLVRPSAARPARGAAGDPLWLTIASATGLTPPPGRQEPRAHRGLYVGLCAEGRAAGAAARICTPLGVDDLRPCASHSLLYRVRSALPAWLAPGAYDLSARFPGAEVVLPLGLVITGPAGTRVHVGPSGLRALPEGAIVHPLPHPAGGFGPGYTLTLAAGVVPAPSSALLLVPRPAGEQLPIALTLGEAPALGHMPVSVRGAPAGSALFVASSEGQLAREPDAELRVGSGGVVQVRALAVAPDGRTGFAQAERAVAPRVGFSCRVGWGCGPRAGLGLLGLLVSATLGRRFAARRLREPGATRIGPG